MDRVRSLALGRDGENRPAGRRGGLSSFYDEVRSFVGHGDTVGCPGVSD